MSRPNNSIGKIKLPGENVERPIIPYALGYNSSNGYQATLPELTADAILALRTDLDAYLPRSGGASKPLTAPVYISHADLSFIGTAGGFGFRAAAQSGQSVPHLGQINLSKNFGGDGNQYGIQMSAVDITNNRFNQFRVYQAGIAYQQYNNATGVTNNLFVVDTTGKATVSANPVNNMDVATKVYVDTCYNIDIVDLTLE